MSDGWAFVLFFGGVILAVMVLIFGSFATWVKAINEAECNQRATLQKVVGGDYKLLSDRCYFTLHDGSVIDANQYRPVEEVTR